MLAFLSSLFAHVWTFVMHSRSVLCMTGHYNFYYVCMYVQPVRVCGTLTRLVHAGRLRVRESGEGDGRVAGEGQRHSVYTRHIRHARSRRFRSAGVVGPTLDRLPAHLQHGDHRRRPAHVPCVRHLLVRAHLRLRRPLQRLHRQVFFAFLGIFIYTVSTKKRPPP